MLEACSDDPTTEASTGTGDGDGGPGRDGASTKDGASPSNDAGAGDGALANDGAASDGACVGPIVSSAGETCTGFGTQGDSCDPSCGQPFGYVCFGGAPPGFTGCREQRVSATFGNTYCCPTNACVERPDRTIDCAGVAGKPKHFQCPPLAGDAGGNASPPSGCVGEGSGQSSLEKYYCCP